MEIEIRLYETEDGAVPFRDWMDSIMSKPAYAVIMNRLERLETGNLGSCRSVGGGVMELKIDYGPGYRVYLGRDGMELVILLIGGDKNSQDRDIKIAKKYWGNYRA